MNHGSVSSEAADRGGIVRRQDLATRWRQAGSSAAQTCSTRTKPSRRKAACPVSRFLPLRTAIILMFDVTPSIFPARSIPAKTRQRDRTRSLRGEELEKPRGVAGSARAWWKDWIQKFGESDQQF